MSKRGQRVAPPPRPGDWEVRLGDKAAGNGWEDLCRQAPGPTRDAFEAIERAPRDPSRPHRQHRLGGELGTREIGGAPLEQWQLEVTAGGRIWYCIDDKNKRVIVTLATPKHPKLTE